MRYSHKKKYTRYTDKKKYKKKTYKKKTYKKKTYKNRGGNKSLATAAKISKTLTQNIYKSIPAVQTIVPNVYSSQPSSYISSQIPINNLNKFNINTFDNIPSQNTYNMPNKFSVLNAEQGQGESQNTYNMPNKFSVLNAEQGQGENQGQGQNWNYKNVYDEELFKKHLDEDNFVTFLDFLINVTEKTFDVKIQRFDTRNKFKIMTIIKEGSKEAVKNLKKKQEEIKNKKKPLNLLNQSFEQKKEENIDNVNNFKNNIITGYEFINDLKKRISDAEEAGEDLSQFDEARSEAINVLIEIEENLEKIEEDKTGTMREY
jgi:hypothetical protein